MNKKNKILLKITLILSMFCALDAFASAEEYNKHTDANLFGHVTDMETGEHLPYIAIVIKGTNIIAMTDVTGHYFLKHLPEGKVTLKVSGVGYFPVEKTVELSSHNTKELNIELKPDRVALNEVVVSANRSETLRKLSPNLVNVINNRLFESTHSITLSQGLVFQPGVRVEDNCQNCGFSQVRINGLDGYYSQILIDSRPIFSALNGVYGLEQIPSNMIERVEVVRGGGSALYGSSAIGGTINIITKEPIRDFAELASSVGAIGGFRSFEYNTTANASVISKNNNAGFYVYGHNRHRDGWDKDNDGYTEMPTLDNKTIGFRSFYRLSSSSKLNIEYHAMQEYRRGGNMLDRPAHEANIAEQLRHKINGGNINYDYVSENSKHKLNTYVSFQHTFRNSYYGGTGENNDEASILEAMKSYGSTTGLTVVGGAQYVYSFDKLLFMPANFTLGSEGNFDGLKDEVLGYSSKTEQNIFMYGFYAQNEWTNNKFSFLLGGRMDVHPLVKHPIFSPRVNLRYNPNDHFNLRLSYAGGFRAPQLFDEQLHVDLVAGERIISRLADNLKEERSHSVSFSSDMYGTWGRLQANLLFEGFYTRLNDVFASTLTEKNGIKIKERRNAYGANVYGVNVEGKVSYGVLFSLQGGLTVQKNEYTIPVKWDETAPAEKRMLRTPGVYGYFVAKTEPLKNFNINFSGTYTGSMLVGRDKIEGGPYAREAVAINTPAFFTFDTMLSYDIRLYQECKLELNLGIKNIFDSFQKDFDKGWSRASTYIYGPTNPRIFFTGLKIKY